MYFRRLLLIFVCVLILVTFVSATSAQRILALPDLVTMRTSVPITQAPDTKVLVGFSGIAFVDSQHGWMLSHYTYLDKNQEDFTVDYTTDGGQSWQVLSVLCQAPDCHSTNLSPQVGELRFANSQEGWAFGPELYSTHDGGKIWKKEAMEGAVRALETAGEKVWIIQETCTDTPGSQCVTSVLISADSGQTWQLSKSSSEMIPAKLIVLDSQSALILYFTVEAGEPRPNTPEPPMGMSGLVVGIPHIIATRDGGNTWQPVNFPADCDGDWGTVDLAAADDQNLWFACGSYGAGPWGAKRILTSSDGGQSWQLKAKADLPEEPDDTITSYGYLGNLYAFSVQSAWMLLGRANPIVTNNGGRSWQTLSSFVGTGTEDRPDKRLIWVDSDHIWYYSPYFLFSTRDGGLSWVCQRTPLSYSYGTECSEE